MCMCETLKVQCPFCHFVALKWTVKCEARLAGVPCFKFDLKYRKPQDFDGQPCEYCSATPSCDGQPEVRAAPPVFKEDQALFPSFLSGR